MNSLSALWKIMDDSVRPKIQKRFLRSFLKHKFALAGFLCIAIITALSVFSNLVTKYDPDEQGDLRDELQIPRDAVVFGRHGALETFDVPFVHDVVTEVASVQVAFGMRPNSDATNASVAFARANEARKRCLCFCARQMFEDGLVTSS